MRHLYLRYLSIAVISALLGNTTSLAAEPLPARQLAEQIATRPANEGRVGTMHFVLTNSAGVTRERQALLAHADHGGSVKIAMYFTAPAAIRDTAFLSLEHRQQTDEAWLYLPATDRVRRIPTSARGDYFLGTDLTYGDIQDNFRFSLDDWDFRDCSSPEDTPATGLVCLAGSVRDAGIAGETGYSAFIAQIDTETLFPTQIDFVDADGFALKRVRVLATEQVGGAWTAMRFEVEHLQSGHRTEVFFTGMRHVPALPDAIFDPEALAFGTPRLP